ncbi:MAG: DUF192 domain-containing protein, partial [Phormidesmis sp.]
MYRKDRNPLTTRMAVLFTLLLLCQATLIGCTMPANLDIDGTTSETVDETTNSQNSAITLNGPGQLLPVSAVAQMRGETFDIEVAKTSAEQSLGLMFRSALPDNRGMLFPFSPPKRVSFWMKDVPVALDMVFLRAGKVVAIAPA